MDHDHLEIVRHNPFLTTVSTPNGHDTLYSVESWRQGGWSSTIFTAEPSQGCSEELASVAYVNPGTTRVTFGTRTVDLDAFLKRRSAFSNSRIFVGPNGETYKWCIRGRHLELYHVPSRALIARSHPLHMGLFSRKERAASLTLVRKTFDPQTLDAVIVTFVIMDHLLQERLQYGSW